MAKAGLTRGRTPRVRVEQFAQAVGATVEAVREYMRGAKSYRDAARKWGQRHGVNMANQWTPWSITAMAMSDNPAESFRRAWNNLFQRLEEGVSASLNRRASDYTANLAARMIKDPEYLLNERMQRIVTAIQTGELTPKMLLKATGGMSLTAAYTKRLDDGSVQVDFSPLMEMVERVLQ